MGKYIIEVGDAYVRHALGRKLIIPVIINNDTEYWVNTNIQLTPYTEPDLEQVREEAYQKGLKDAWEAARKIAVSEVSGGFTYEELETIFGTDTVAEIFDIAVSEAIEKIRQYEQKKEQQIQVGDEVKCIEANWTAIVTKIKEESLTLMDDSGAIADGYEITKFVKTGRHFPEIAAVLAKMKETE